MSNRWSLANYLFNSGMPDDDRVRESWEERHPLLFGLLAVTAFVVVMGVIVFVSIV